MLEDKRKDIFNENPVTGEYYWVNYIDPNDKTDKINYILAKNEGEEKYKNETNKFYSDEIVASFSNTIRENQIDWSE